MLPEAKETLVSIVAKHRRDAELELAGLRKANQVLTNLVETIEIKTRRRVCPCCDGHGNHLIDDNTSERDWEYDCGLCDNGLVIRGKDGENVYFSDSCDWDKP